MKKGILIRVGADGTDLGGNWNAPVDPVSGRFLYIPIMEAAREFHPGCERRFDEVSEPLMGFLADCRLPTEQWKNRMDAKRGRTMHLDPDYEHLTYGDAGKMRGRDLGEFEPGDLIVFYSGLKSIRPQDDLVYALVGLYVVQTILLASSVEATRRSENAHTRKANIHPDDIVVRAQPGVSGRCSRCIQIGEKRGKSNYFLKPEIEAQWGGLKKANGSPRKSAWLNRSATPPLLGDAPGFYRWWQQQNVNLVQSNFVV